MALISDILRGPYGDPQPNVIITMRAKETSARVLVSNSSAATTADDGKYSMQVFPGEYEVMVSTLGKVGEIRVYPDSKDGTLNDFLITPGEEEITPEIVQTVETLRAEAAASAGKSAASASAAKVSEQNAANSVKPVTAAGFGTGPIHRADVYAQENTSFINRFNGTSVNAPANLMGAVLATPMDGGPSCGYIAIGANGAAWVGHSNVSTAKKVVWSPLWGASNTTVDANGFIKKASPIVKLFRDGTCELNDESQGVTTERVSEGIYRISGTLGFNADAQWGGPDGGIEVPLDRNKQPLIWVDYEVEPTGDLLIKTYHRTHPSAPAFARNDVLGYDEGMPIDIPDGRWVDLRVEMPAVDERGTEEGATA
ncbi:TPA: prophage tail fiber N-terminal domain-containing protein [Serratia marcescens]|nr:prophage tail fiber N-terminal domain-containing protein [Serratia marcescens]HCR3025880.1 prophage tail fiber N-terminal domain-containing protein [Serratia marcescens]